MKTKTLTTRAMRITTIITTLAAGMMITGSSLTAQAQPISGSLEFIGGATLNGPLNSATAFTSIFGEVLPGSQTGDYSTVPDLTTAIFTPFSFNPASSSFPLWTFNVGTTTYNFTVTSLNIIHQDTTFLDIAGTGTASISGVGITKTDTSGTWTITDTGLGGSSPVFTFGGSVAVPEPTTIGCLLLGMGTLAFSRRLMRKQ